MQWRTTIDNTVVIFILFTGPKIGHMKPLQEMTPNLPDHNYCYSCSREPSSPDVSSHTTEELVNRLNTMETLTYTEESIMNSMETVTHSEESMMDTMRTVTYSEASIMDYPGYHNNGSFYEEPGTTEDGFSSPVHRPLYVIRPISASP